MTLRIGSLCSGYGGLDMAVESVLGGELAWVADTDPGACKILAHHFPSVPNLGDITEADWTQVEPVDVLVAGFPCQDISDAGKRAGINGARSGIWRNVADAIRVLRPGLVVLENVRALLVRGMGRVLADLADIGFDAEWRVLRASDAGAPHQRARVFIVAWPAADTMRSRRRQVTGGAPRDEGPDAGRPAQGDHVLVGADPQRDAARAPQDADSPARREWRLPAPGQAESGRSRPDSGGPGRAPAADTTSDGRDQGRAESAGIVRRPDAAQRGHGAAPDPEGDRHGNAGPGGGRRIPSAPVSGALADADGHGLPRGAERHGEPLSGQARDEQRRVDPLRRVLDWGVYEPAIRRWEQVLGRPAPRPTEPGRTGERLSPRFVEWMQGLPGGWVTDVPGLSRNAQLHALGNGVVPQQCAMALRLLLGALEAGEAA